jgi:hypothetical protein
VREGDLVVKVIRPHAPPLPGDLRWGYSDWHGRHQFTLAGRPVQDVRVRYQVWTDPLQLRDLEARANSNKSGTAVRGLGHAYAGQPASVDLSPKVIAAIVRRAANNDSHRTAEGPVKVHVTLLEAPEGTPPMCSQCKLGLDAHEIQEFIEQGDWGDPDPDGNRRWDSERPRNERRWLCPEEATP